MSECKWELTGQLLDELIKKHTTQIEYAIANHIQPSGMEILNCKALQELKKQRSENIDLRQRAEAAEEKNKLIADDCVRIYKERDEWKELVNTVRNQDVKFLKRYQRLVKRRFASIQDECQNCLFKAGAEDRAAGQEGS